MASSSFQRNKHSPSSVTCFYKIVLKQSLEDGNVTVPKTFSGVPNPVYLKPPDGTAWKIYWSEYDGGILFENGWKEFASYYSLDRGHLLWFGCNKTSNIEVHIFDMTFLEIDYPSLDHISDDDSIEILNELPPRGCPRKTEKAAPKTPSASTSKMFTSSAKTEGVKWCPEIDYPSKDRIDDDNMVKVQNGPPRRGRGRPRKTEKAAPKTPSACTSKMFTSSVKTRCPEIDYPSKDHINDDNMVKVENEPPRRGRGRPRKKLKAAAEVSSPSTSKILSSSVKTGDVEKAPDKQNWMQCCKNEEASQSE
ncbi:B3 domain-containing transcription factor VRN1-like [Arachis stenosperma]|uniref:B3 domain-containing transcription factor VRN1-like n=1 Tax=Arachis stenosperma TaxID=217475 RepID=UPI0025AC0F68|nr:B3 domain-containing transcription factor VRN1-like [Arachis stenosperma]